MSEQDKEQVEQVKSEEEPKKKDEEYEGGSQGSGEPLPPDKPH